MSDGATLTAVQPTEAAAKARPRLTSFPRRVFDRWTKAAHAIGVVQTRGIMLLMYVFMVLPMGLLARMTRDPLQLKPPAKGNWHECKQSERNVDAARRQF